MVLAHKKQQPPLGLPWGPRHSPTVGSYGRAVHYEQGTLVGSRFGVLGRGGGCGYQEGVEGVVVRPVRDRLLQCLGLRVEGVGCRLRVWGLVPGVEGLGCRM